MIDAEAFLMADERTATPATGQAGRRSVAVPRLPLRDEPDAACAYATEGLAGEQVTLFDERDGWARVQLLTDGYVGWVPAAGLSTARQSSTHLVARPRTWRYAQPRLKAPPLEPLFMAAPVRLTDQVDGRYVQDGAGSWLIADDLQPVASAQADPVALAATLGAVPYVWGGRTVAGLDCSAFIQLVAALCGHSLPRDSDLQSGWLEANGVPYVADRAQLKRGDIAFFPGHVGWMVDDRLLLHANATAMAVSCDPLDQVIDRLAAGHDRPWLGAYRLDWPGPGAHPLVK